MENTLITFKPYGECAVLMEFEQVISMEVLDQVRIWTNVIESSDLPGLTEVVPAYASLAVFFHPEQTDARDLIERLKDLRPSLYPTGRASARLWEIPVCYTSEYGMDLNAIAAITGLSPAQIVNLHSNTTYTVFMIGFLPGFIYLGGMDTRLTCPRKSTPETRVPAGSVAIGGGQTGIYGIESPGGWHLVGQTPLRMLNPEDEQPTWARQGDFIRFLPIDQSTFTEIREAVLKGDYPIQPKSI